MRILFAVLAVISFSTAAKANHAFGGSRHTGGVHQHFDQGTQGKTHTGKGQK